MYLSKRANGFYYIYYFQSTGKRTCLSTRTKLKSEAVKFLSNFERELEHKRNEKLKPVSLKEYCELFTYYSRNIHTPKTHRGYKQALKNLIKHFGDVMLKDVIHSELIAYFEKRVNESSIYQAKNDLICFSSFFNRAIAEDYLNTNPCKGIKRFRIPQKQPLFYSQIDFELLLKAIDDNDIKDLVQFAVNTGLRQGELLNLKWNQIDYKQQTLILDNAEHLTKSKKVRAIPLTIKVLQILTERERSKRSDFIFTRNGMPIQQDFISHRFKEYVIKAGINPKLNFHSLRHTFASWLIQKGVPVYTISKLLGHSDIKVTEIYSHLRPEDLKTAINTLNN